MGIPYSPSRIVPIVIVCDSRRFDVVTNFPSRPGSPIQPDSTASSSGAGAADHRAAVWVVTSLGGVMLFASWLWLGLVREGARQDRGQAGQEYADALVKDLGITPVIVAHVMVLAVVMAVGAWSRKRNGPGFMIPVLVCVAASIAGLLISIPLTAPIPALP